MIDTQGVPEDLRIYPLWFNLNLYIVHKFEFISMHDLKYK